ncbi:phosphomannomutase [Labedella gwakjiensis]|uniref:Phospho-sugar mutase n=1 Tax=Labedella gwakjiensis TaxID=390269 RepID=A0A2P8GXR2_9MICO|nr:phospho-sugar mutase [Labedella gwakjiensis]PSL38753.1 phosphomannomutase [Labedella gwakjiensis]RUQ86765.1 phospho-sugar mutase [Labedella gwakjiensis]
MSAGRLARAQAWLAQDPDEETRAELQDLIDAVEGGSAEAEAALADRFDSRLAFGTAGLRGELAAGPNRMNRVLVTQAARGLADWLLASGPNPSIVIGYDGRKNSRIFAEDTAQIMAGAGIRAVLLPRLLPTPVLAFAVRHLDVSAGVMVTASHNPPRDNGYKVYLGGRDAGSQIVSPVDAEIAAAIDVVAAGSIVDLPRSDDFEVADESVVDAYVSRTAAVAAAAPAAQPVVVYTAMHGVGWETTSRVLEAAGFAAPILVEEQLHPDPDFPTVAFPNPEEPGALDLSYASAREHSADLIIANDPDADRLAVAIPDATQPTGYRRLTGNEVGSLLGWRAAESLSSHDEAAAEGTLACSIVSSPALAAVAKHYGLEFADTLTGFKWVSRAPGLVFGYEEALGYLVNPETVRDKDGISAAVAFLDLAARLAAEGSDIATQLDRFSETFGHFASDQVSVRVDDLSRITATMTRLRDTPPRDIGGVRVERVEDLAGGFGSLPPSDVLRFRLEDGSRVMVRPSGTEPKLKVYIDVSSDTGTLAERIAEADARLAALRAGVADLVA